MNSTLCRRIQFTFGNCTDSDLASFDTTPSHSSIPETIHLGSSYGIYILCILFVTLVIAAEIFGIFYVCVKAKRRNEMRCRNNECKLCLSKN